MRERGLANADCAYLLGFDKLNVAVFFFRTELSAAAVIQPAVPPPMMMTFLIASLDMVLCNLWFVCA